MSSVLIQGLRIIAFTLFPPPSPVHAHRWEDLSLLNPPSNKSSFLGSENKQNVESSEILLPDPDGSFWIAFSLAPLNKANKFLSFGFCSYLSIQREILYLNLPSKTGDVRYA